MNPVLSTLIYADLFSFPLKQEEIWRFLIEEKKSKKPVAKELENLKKRSLIEEKEGFFFLRGKKEHVNRRKKGQKEASFKIKKIKKIVPILKKAPFLKAIALTGGLACGNVKEDDDIDLLIISKGNRLWLIRPILILLLEILGIRRRPGQKKVKDKVCLNILLDEKALSLSQKKRNLFTSFEIAQMKFLWQKDEMERRFLEANKWVEKYLPNGMPNFKVQMSNQVQNPNYQKNFLISQFLNICNFVFYKLQIFYMKNRKTKEEVGLSFAFFHPEDKAKKVLRKFFECT